MISLIAAVGENRAIGLQGKLPWRLPADMKRFRELTTGHAVVMGRKTYESIGKPLPDRKNIVISRRPAYQAPGCVVVQSLGEAVRAAGSGEMFIIGGEKIYAEALSYADRLYLTRVHAAPEADAFFPEFQESEWRAVAVQRFEKDQRNEYPYDFMTYDRVAGKQSL